MNRVIHSSMTRISDLDREAFDVQVRPRGEWDTGDYVVVEVTGDPSPWILELVTGRQVELGDGDLLLGALGHRHATLEATGTWEEVGEDGRMHLLTGGGLLGRCTSRSSQIPPLPRVTYAGHVVRDGRKVKMRDFVLRGADERNAEKVSGFSVPTILIVGTSMSAGKTAAARIVIRRLTGLGFRVMAAKVTGAGRYRDILTMSDSGADPVYDFVDAGLPSSVCPAGEYQEALEILLSRMQEVPADVVVIEVGASPMEPYNGDIAVERLRSAVRLSILCASDPYAVVGLIEAFGIRPDLVTGVASNTRAGVELVERLTGIPCMDIRLKNVLPELDELLRKHLDLE